VLIFSLASVVAELLAICDFSQNKSCKTYLGPMLPPGSRNWRQKLAAETGSRNWQQKQAAETGSRNRQQKLAADFPSLP
jgi:hypothetical protein